MAADLERLWLQIAKCERDYDPEALASVCEEAQAAMNSAMSMALRAGGLRLVEPIWQSMDMRGW